MSKKIAIVGYGFVGKAVEHGFDIYSNQIYLVDPLVGKDIPTMFKEFEPEIIFICVPTPMGDNGVINSSIIETVMSEIYDHTTNVEHKPLVIIKSTITPDIAKKLCASYPRTAYVPEFMRERHAFDDFVNHQMLVIGSESTYDSTEIQDLFENHSKCVRCAVHYVKPEIASMIKYTLNTFLATKVLFFNELYDVFGQLGISDSFDKFTDIISNDARIGPSHMQVPGPDGRFGFGGACFAKDTAAFIRFSENIDKPMTLLKHAVLKNIEYRSKYSDLDQREKEQNVTYDFRA